jgi:hypothetical protein
VTDLFFHENGKTHSCAIPQQQQHRMQDRQRIRRGSSSVDKSGREEKKCSTALQVLFPNDSPPLSLSLVVTFHSPQRLQKHVPPPPPPFLSLCLSVSLSARDFYCYEPYLFTKTELGHAAVANTHTPWPFQNLDHIW